MDALWCGVRMPDRVELHMFPVDGSSYSTCRRRMRGRDDVNFVMKGAPSAPGGCVCRTCWDAYVKEVM